MIIDKYFETRLEINDPIDLFSKDYEQTILDILKKQYTNVCYKSSFIISINKIVRRSSLYCKSKTLDGGIYFDVQFKASCIVYDKGEILHNCSIVKVTDKNILFAKTKQASIRIKNITKLNVFKEGEHIPVIIQGIRYPPFKPEIAITAIPFIPVKTDQIIYKISDDSKVSCDFSLIDKQLARLKKFSSKNIKFFADLLDQDDIDGKSCDIKKFDPVGFCAISGQSDKANIIKVADSENYLEISAEDFISKAIFEINKNMENLLGFLENYNEKDIKANSVIWSVYKTVKDKK
jgi:hypothetical protein